MKPLRLGIIGMSSGNGHPYSWSAIFNGYDHAEMAKCPYPAIPEYLARQQFPMAAIPGAAVTHIWTQQRSTSEQIARASKITHIVDDLRDMVGIVDAVLLARDDAENHMEFAAPFLESDIPIYIDKPLALSSAIAMALYDRQRRPGQIFTCSALSYASELQLSIEEKKSLGPIFYIDAVTPKYWDTYGMHIIEPLLAIMGPGASPTNCSGGLMRHLDLKWPNGAVARLTALGNASGPISLRVFGERGFRELIFHDSFAAFRSALSVFVDIVRGIATPQPPDGPLAAVRILELGRNLA